jgi:RNA polymerase sigma-70 factor (ECF subfamily)
MVRSWCSRGGVPGNDVEDVMQEVFAAVTAGLAEFRRDRPGDTFRGWLRVITRNKVLLYFRRTRRVPKAEGGSEALEGFEAIPDPLGSFSAEDDAAEAGELYRRALEQVRGEFEERTWQIFWLTVVEGRAAAALAAELCVTPAAIRQAKSRVLRRIKQEVGDLID